MENVEPVQNSLQESSSIQPAEQKPHGKRNWKKWVLFTFLFMIIFVIFSYFFLTMPRQVGGSPIKPFNNGETVFAEKISYMVTNPQVGDRILFNPVSKTVEYDYVGVITKIDDSRYTVVSKSIENPWIISRSEILAKIYYPFIASQKTLQIISSQIPTPTLTPLPDQTANWKTYTSTESGYTVKYPPAFFLEKEEVAGESVIFHSMPKPTGTIEGKAIANLKYDVGVGVYDAKEKTLADIAKNYDEFKTREGYKREDFTLVNVKGYKISNAGIDFPTDIVVVLYNNKQYSLYVKYYSNDPVVKTQAKNEFNQMLSTFEFMLQSYSLDTPTKAVFMNTKYSYSVSYPSVLVPITSENDPSVLFEYPRYRSGSPIFYISVFSYSKGIDRDTAVYNNVSQNTIERVLSLKIGETVDRTTTYDIGGAWNQKTDYKRLEDAVVNGESFLVIENNGYGGVDRRLFLKKNNYIYMLGTHYQDDQRLIDFQKFYSSFKFTQ